MRVYKVFIASSIVDFASERNKLVLFFSRLSKAVGDIRFDTFICEYSSKAIALSRKQDVFNDEIAQSDYFVLLARDQIGNYTMEEFETALASLAKAGSPHIAAFCGSDACRAKLLERVRDDVPSCYVGSFRNLGETKAVLVNLLSTQLATISPDLREDGSIWINNCRIVSSSELRQSREGVHGK